MHSNNKILLVFFSLFFIAGSIFTIYDSASKIKKMKEDLRKKEIEIENLEDKNLEHEIKIIDLQEEIGTLKVKKCQSITNKAHR
jgi:hypothetical protein